MKKSVLIIERSLVSVPGKVYERVLKEKLMKVTEGKVSDEQGRYRKGKGCLCQVFLIKRVVEE